MSPGAGADVVTCAREQEKLTPAAQSCLEKLVGEIRNSNTFVDNRTGKHCRKLVGYYCFRADRARCVLFQKSVAFLLFFFDYRTLYHKKFQSILPTFGELGCPLSEFVFFESRFLLLKLCVEKGRNNGVVNEKAPNSMHYELS